MLPGSASLTAVHRPWTGGSRRATEHGADDLVKLERDSDGDTTVELVGPSQQMQIALNRGRKESIRIAREFAARVAQPIVGEDEDDGETGAG